MTLRRFYALPLPDLKPHASPLGFTPAPARHFLEGGRLSRKSLFWFLYLASFK
ncbi:hypothetical protein VCHENC02_1492A, partial [Vibrio harveyi]